MRFSERYGHKKVRELVQLESIDEPLRNTLWNLLKIHVWNDARHSNLLVESNHGIKLLCEKLWFNFFKKPLDNLSKDWPKVLIELKKFFFGCEWFEVYDFIEFVANNYSRYEFREQFTENCNATLEKEVSAYRFVDGFISRIIEREQIEEIELALERNQGPVQTHLRRALELISDRNAPDYRNSIKESISAVESLVIKVVGTNKGTLGQLLKKLENEIGLHPAIKTAYSNLYGYTSDEGGIRHALLESEKIGFEDAKFFLVVCSAFINFVDAKVGAPG